MPSRAYLGLLCVFALSSFSTACTTERDEGLPGPHEDEKGQVMYWKVASSESRTQSCTDSPDFVVPMLMFQENTYLMYRVDDSLTRATVQQCETSNASSCVDSMMPQIVFDIDPTMHRLTWASEPLSEPAVMGSMCNLQQVETWTVTDQGEKAELLTSLTYKLIGPEEACKPLNDASKAKSSNGFGIDGCTIHFVIDLEYSHMSLP